MKLIVLFYAVEAAASKLMIPRLQLPTAPHRTRGRFVQMHLKMNSATV